MADWIKIRHSLIRSPKIYALARELKCKKHAALGVAVSWLVWIDEQTEDGRTHLSPDELADEIGFRGCAEALIEIGWAALGSDGCVEAVEFGKHCGESAKKRAENALRKARSRLCGEKCHAKSVTDVTQSVTQNALPEEKRKEENNTMVSGSTTVDGSARGAASTLPPFSSDDDDAFKEWLGAMCGCVPQLSAFRALPQDVVAAAREAWECLPGAAAYVPLLTAYYASRLQEDKRRKPFWRPAGAQFFRDLGDVIFKHAERWRLEVGWKQASERRVKEEEKPNEEDCMSPEDMRAMWEQIKEEVGVRS